MDICVKDSSAQSLEMQLRDLIVSRIVNVRDFGSGRTICQLSRANGQLITFFEVYYNVGATLGVWVWLFVLEVGFLENTIFKSIRLATLIRPC